MASDFTTDCIYNFAQNFSNVFPGTVVNLEFNITDTKSYRLVSEVDDNDLF